MTDNYLGEIRLFGFDYAPQGWHLCDGTQLNIQQNMALYSLIGLTYGGDGKTTFALPDLRGRTPIDMGQSSWGTMYQLGKAEGQEAVSLNTQEMPKHSHAMLADNSAGNKGVPTGNLLAIPTAKDGSQISVYNTASTTVAPLNPATIENTGGSAAHGNMQPFLSVNFCIALTGFYPPRP